MTNLVELLYKGHRYWAQDVRYWLRAVADGFVYDASDDPDELLQRRNEHVQVWDREESAWVTQSADQPGGDRG